MSFVPYYITVLYEHSCMCSFGLSDPRNTWFYCTFTVFFLCFVFPA